MLYENEYEYNDAREFYEGEDYNNWEDEQVFQDNEGEDDWGDEEEDQMGEHWGDYDDEDDSDLYGGWDDQLYVNSLIGFLNSSRNTTNIKIREMGGWYRLH